MIFDRFFKPKYKNDDPKVRIESIQTLNLDEQKDKHVLHELAFNDSHPQVMLAALDKLNSFSLWVKASEISEHKSVRDKALAKVESELGNPQSSLVSEQDFYTFCSELKNTALLESLLFNNKRLYSNDVLVLSALEKIDKENTTRQFYKQRASSIQKQAIIDSTNSINVLTKLNKIEQDENIKLILADKIYSIQQALSKPKEIKQNASLVTSKLLASRDISDYELLRDTQKALVEEFKHIAAEFHVLKKEESAEIENKFTTINDSVTKRLHSLKEVWQYNQSLSETTNKIAEVESQINDVVGQIEALSVEQSVKDLTAQIKILNLSLKDASSTLVDIEHLQKTIAHERWLKKLFRILDENQTLLSDLPSICELNQVAKQIIDELEDYVERARLADSAEEIDSIERHVQGTKSNWKQKVVLSDLSISVAVAGQWKKACKSFSDAVKAFKDEQDKLRKQTVNKLRTVQRLIEQGKFKSAIASFKFAQNHYQELTDSTRIQVDKMYRGVSEKIEELQALQAFIAAPRKPALIDEVKALLDTPVVDAKLRSEEVKRLRAQWSSFGLIDSEEDKALNKKFDELIERAFQPCRDFFAEQEKIRAQNKRNALELIGLAKALLDTSTEDALSKALSMLQQRWRDLGQIENSEYKKLQSEFKKSLQPAQKRVEELFKSNAESKQRLLKKARALLEQEDLKQATSDAKQLQQEWKGIGFAGKKQDDALWKEFRAINDQLFATFNELAKAERTEQSSKIEQINHAHRELESSIAGAKSIQQLDSLKSKLENVKPDIEQIKGREKNSLFKESDELARKIKVKIKNLHTLEKAEDYRRVFSALVCKDEEKRQSILSSVSPKFRGFFEKTVTVSTQLEDVRYNREDLVMLIELVCDVPNQLGDSAKRKALQLELMAKRLEGQTIPDAEQLLADFIRMGPLSDTEFPLVERLRVAFVGDIMTPIQDA